MSDRPITLFLVDDDPIFALGLATALAEEDNLQILGRMSSLSELETALAQQQPQILVLEAMLVLDAELAWQRLSQLRQAYPALKIYLLSRLRSRPQLIAAQELGVEGYAPKGISLPTLKAHLRRIADGGRVWGDLTLVADADLGRRRSPRQRSRPWLIRLQQSGLQQINSQIEPINSYLRQSRLSLWDRLFWTGRRRELRLARWLVRRLIPVEVVVVSAPPPEPLALAESSPPVSALSARAEGAIISFGQEGSVIDRTSNRLRSPVANITPIPLEIDILLPDKRNQLLALVLDHLTQSLNALKSYQLSPSQLPNPSAELLQDIWQDSTLSFLAPLAATHTWALDDLQTQIEDYGDLIQGEILNRIPCLKEFWDYFLFNEGLVIERVSYRPESPEACDRATLLLQNLVIAIANGVMVFILNTLADEELIKQILFQADRRSYREIARFRNNLTWHYRFNQFFETPKNIFESQYPIFYLGAGGIQTLNFYAPRLGELQQLQGIPWAVTILLELRDAISPRLRATIEFLGDGVVYLLTKVIGRAIGLVGRGIIQGVGKYTWQNTRYGKNQDRRDSQL